VVAKYSAKSVGFAISVSRYSRASLSLCGGITGRSGQWANLFLALRQRTKWSGFLGCPQEHSRRASSCLNLRWYQAKSPWFDLIAISRWSVVRGRLSSGGSFVL
jgi:hypothetical protein